MKTTAEDFERFKERFFYYTALLNQRDWDFRFAFKPLADEQAKVSWDMTARTAGITLNEGENANDVECLACHEALELMLAKLTDMATDLYSVTRVAGEVHRVIELLCKIIRSSEE